MDTPGLIWGIVVHINTVKVIVYVFLFLKIVTTLAFLIFIGFPKIHLSHELWVQIDYTSHTCISLHVYNDEKKVLFYEETLADTRIQTRSLPTHVFSIAAGTFHTGFTASYSVRNTVVPLHVASTLGDLAAAATTALLVPSKQTHSFYIQKEYLSICLTDMHQW